MRLNGDEWETWSLPRNHSLFGKFKELELKYIAGEYATQKKLLEKRNEQTGEEKYFVSNAPEGASVELVIRVAFRRWPLRPDSALPALVLAAVLLAWLLDTGRLIKKENDDFASARFVERNFYGALRIRDSGLPTEFDSTRTLTHGTINHGEQFLNAMRRDLPTTYYGPSSGAALAIAANARLPSRTGTESWIRAKAITAGWSAARRQMCR